MKKKEQKGFDPNEVEWLLMVAQSGAKEGFDPEEIPIKYSWIKRLTPLQARDELVMRFGSLTANLVNVCMTGNINYRTTSQKRFLRLFAHEETPLENIAAMLKDEIMGTEKEDLKSIALLARLQAIDMAETNYAGTITHCFKDLIKIITKDGRDRHLDEEQASTLVEDTLETEISLRVFLESLDEEEWQIATKIIEGDKVTNIPKSLKVKFQDYLGYSL